ncbi:hypothetical protein H0H93_002059 [Arthromyces matolae]|nr:hypothetical protein H0H93_002059 [Arthromyces matolae]
MDAVKDMVGQMKAFPINEDADIIALKRMRLEAIDERHLPSNSNRHSSEDSQAVATVLELLHQNTSSPARPWPSSDRLPRRQSLVPREAQTKISPDTLSNRLAKALQLQEIGSENRTRYTIPSSRPPSTKTLSRQTSASRIQAEYYSHEPHSANSLPLDSPIYSRPYSDDILKPSESFHSDRFSTAPPTRSNSSQNDLSSNQSPRPLAIPAQLPPRRHTSYLDDHDIEDSIHPDYSDRFLNEESLDRHTSLPPPLFSSRGSSRQSSMSSTEHDYLLRSNMPLQPRTPNSADIITSSPSRFSPYVRSPARSPFPTSLPSSFEEEDTGEDPLRRLNSALYSYSMSQNKRLVTTRPPPSAWQLYFVDWMGRNPQGDSRLNIAQAAKQAGREYATLSNEAKEASSFYLTRGDDLTVLGQPYRRLAQAAKERYDREGAMTAISDDFYRDVTGTFNSSQWRISHDRRSREVRLKDVNAPKKPLGAFFLFLQEIRGNSQMAKDVFQDETETMRQSVQAAAKWRSMTEDERQPYLTLAEKEKKEYEAARKVYDEAMIHVDATGRARRHWSSDDQHLDFETAAKEEEAKRKKSEETRKEEEFKRMEEELKSREQAIKAREAELEVLADSARKLAIRSILVDARLHRHLLKCAGEEAQLLLDFFQSVLDSDGFPDRGKVVVAMQRLSAKTELYPLRYILDGPLKLVEDHPVNAGRFADIYRANFRGEVICLKVVRVFDSSLVQHMAKIYAREAIIWGQLSHPNLLPFCGLYMFQSKLAFVAPWAANGNLTDYLARVPDANRVLLCADMSDGIEYLHANEVVHGDLKGVSTSEMTPQQLNVLVDGSGRACLSDFGLSGVSDKDIVRWATQSSTSSKGGTTRWQAPELHDPDVLQMHNTKESDIFAWASTCYEVFTGNPPFFEVQRETAVAFMILRGDIPTRPLKDICWKDRGLTESIWELLKDCWKTKPSERPNITSVKSRLGPAKPLDPRPPGQWQHGFAMRFRNAQEDPSSHHKPSSLGRLDDLLSRVMDESRKSVKSTEG